MCEKTFLLNGMYYFNNLLLAAVELVSICKANILMVLLF